MSFSSQIHEPYQTKSSTLTKKSRSSITNENILSNKLHTNLLGTVSKLLHMQVTIAECEPFNACFVLLRETAIDGFPRTGCHYGQHIRLTNHARDCTDKPMKRQYLLIWRLNISKMKILFQPL